MPVTDFDPGDPRYWGVAPADETRDWSAMEWAELLQRQLAGLRIVAQSTRETLDDFIMTGAPDGMHWTPPAKGEEVPRWLA